MTPHSIVSSNDIQKKKITKVCDKKVLLLCGLPGAGKSTLARHFVAEQEASSVALIEYDDIQDSLLLMNYAKEEPDEQHALQAWRSSRTSALQALAERLDDSTTTLVVLDDNFQLQSMRKQIFHSCQNHVTGNNYNTNSNDRTIHFGLIWINTSVDLCLERNHQRPPQRRVPDPVIQNMNHKFEAPGEKGFLWEQSFLPLDGTDSLSTHLDELRQFLSSSQQLTLVPPRLDPAVDEARIAVARQETQASRTHQLDQYLRWCVQAVAQNHKQCAGAANQCRKRLLSDLKHRHDLVFTDIEQEFVNQMMQITFSPPLDWKVFQPILHRELLAKQTELNGVSGLV